MRFRNSVPPLLALALGGGGPEVPAPEASAASVLRVVGEVGAGLRRNGSGVMVAPGWVATSAHVVEGARSISVSRGGGTWPAYVARMDPARDLALLRVPGCPVPPAPFADPALAVEGLPVAALGYPGAGGRDLVRTEGRLVGVWKYRGSVLYQSDAPTRPGSSGGGLFDARGRLLGLCTFAFPHSKGMNFAIPAAWVRALAEDPAEGPAPRGAFLNQDFVAQMAEEPENWPAWERFCRLWVKDQPDDPDAWLALGHALDRSWREQRLRDPEGPEGLHLESIGAYRRALELRGGQARVWNNLGAALEADNRFAEAETAFLEALRLDPDYGLAWINLGSTRMNTGRCGAAVEAFRKGLERVPDHSETWGRLGYCLAQTGRWAEAVEALRVAVAQRPFQADLWSDLAKAARQAGERELAQEAQARLRALRKGG